MEVSKVGVFWLVDDVLLVHTTPLGKAEAYGDFLIHSDGHDKVWEKYQENGVVPGELEYDEPPRGRVMYDTKTCRFTLLADRCILRRNDLAEKIKKEMHLPNAIKVGSDPHYRCSACLVGADDRTRAELE